MGVISKLFESALETVISNACEDGAVLVYSKLNGDKKRLKRFRAELSEWETEFEKKKDGTIVSKGYFYEYIEDKKDIDKIIGFVLSQNPSFPDEILSEDELVEILIKNLNHYLISEKDEFLTPTDQGVIREFYTKIMQISKNFILNKLVDSKDISQNYKLNQIYYLLTQIHQNTEDIVHHFKQYAQYVSGNEEIDFYILLKNLSKSFIHEKHINPSYALVDFDEKITPKITFNEKNTVSLDGSEKSGSIKDFLDLSFQNEKNHIFLYGMGGIGKTVSLLSIDYKNPVIYVPLRNILNEERCIENYIKEQTLHSSENDYNLLLKYCELAWDEKQHLILIIDGLNEVDSSLRKLVVRQIEIWSQKKNVQLIITSRNDMSYDMNCGCLWSLKTNFLSRETIIEFLAANDLDIPYDADKIWNVIDTPLMLVLYVRNEYLRKRIKNNVILLRENVNSASIIWNFLQSEVYRLQKSVGSQMFASIIAAEFITPFIAYQMQRDNKFIVTQEKFRCYVQNAYELYQNCQKKGILSSYMYSLIESEEGGDEIKKDSLVYILTNKLCLFKSTGKNIQLIHQHFRDCFAAMHIFQTAEMYDMVPDEWKTPFTYDVGEFLAELIMTENVFGFDVNTWDKVWKNKHKLTDPEKVFIPQMLHLYKLCFGDDLSKVNFSGLDLSNVSLNGYIFSEQSKNNFKNTILSSKTFFGNGHRKSITSVSWSPANENFFSVSHDCTVRMWDTDTKVACILHDDNNFHKHYIRCAKWNPVDENMFITAGDDKNIIVWLRKNNKWFTKSLGSCEDWIVGISWSNDGENIICGDRSGNVSVFNLKGDAIKFKKTHTDYVRRISCSMDNSEVFATGSDDGIVCIWDKNSLKPLKVLKFNDAIMSVDWVGNSKFLSVSVNSMLYCFDVRRLFDNADNVIVCKDASFIKRKFPGNISYIAVTTHNMIDFYSVFYDGGIDILMGCNRENQPYSFSLISSKSTNSEDFNKIICAEWNKSCDRIICGSRDGCVSEIQIDLFEEHKDRMAINTIGNKNNNAARCVSWSHDNKYLAVGYDDCKVRVWDLEKKCCIKVFQGHKDSVKCVVWSPNDEFIASGSDDTMIKIWSVKDGKHIKTSTFHRAPVNCILWLKNNYIVSGSDDKMVIKFNFPRIEEHKVLKNHTKRIYGLTASADEKYVISIGNDKILCLWNIEKGEIVQYMDSEHSEPIRGVDWSCQGDIVTASNDCSWIIRAFDNNKNNISYCGNKKENAHSDFIYSICITSNNKYVVTGSTDYKVGFWKIDNQELIGYGEAHDFFVWSVKPNYNIDNSSFVATTSSDGTVKIWETNELTKGCIEPLYSLDVIANIDVVACDFKNAVFESEELKELLRKNGAIVSC